MSQSTATVAQPPETAEGWYALHQVYAVDRSAVRAATADDRAMSSESLERTLRATSHAADGGWSVGVKLVGNRADLMLVHFRSTLDAIGKVQERIARESLVERLVPVYSFLSVTEAGLYHMTAELARNAVARGGVVGDDAYREELAARTRAEVAAPHVQRRLYPELPRDMPYVCFYPMSKRREPDQNWYALGLDERSRLMQAHGTTGRRFAGRVQQVITGAIGLDAWEWGVTLFAKDPLDFKKLVTDMRFDEVSARYAEFGEFFVGRAADPKEWVDAIA
ncbi:MAG: heme-dependent peroxidase [Gemmatimonadaceae bacterium]